MKIYQGRRTIDGLVVTVDGSRLPEHYEVERFTKYGFEWTYDGTSPRKSRGKRELSTALSSPWTASACRSITKSGNSPIAASNGPMKASSPQQLALAILFDYLADGDRAIALSAPYMKDVIANLDNDWQLSGDDVDAYLRRARRIKLQGERQ